MSLNLDAVREHRDVYLKTHGHQTAFACCTAHASADDVPELLDEVDRLAAALEQRARNEARLMNALDAVADLTKDTDGGDIDGDADIPVGEIRRVLAEAVTW